MNSTDFASIEVDKENIVPLKSGRSAKKLAEIVSMDNEALASKLDHEREEFELVLEDKDQLQEMDDPIEPYIEYIKWIHASYTTGNINDSGLIKILERTTHDFKDDDYYKNEIRYFKVWLEYINYSDRPGDVFKYLHKKKIGSLLSLFYEKYAHFFELNDQWNEAESVLMEGIELKARPISRLMKYFNAFVERKEVKVPKATQNKLGLLNSTGSGLSSVSNTYNKSKKSKIPVFVDKDDLKPKTTDTSIEWDWNHLDTIKNSKKENVINASQWQGQTLKQATTPITKIKLDVFNDQKKQYPITTTRVDKERNRTEVFDFNLDMFINKYGSKPLSMVDVMCTYYNKYKPVSFKRPLAQTLQSQGNTDFTPNHKRIKLPDENKVINTPTVTLTTKQAREEIMSIFDYSIASENPEPFANKDYDVLSDGGLSDFVTETITKSLNLERAKVQVKTPESKAAVNSNQSPDDDIMSSPFLENPNSPSLDSTIIDPFSKQFKHLLSDTESQVVTIECKMDKLGTFNSTFKILSPPIYGSSESLIEFEEGNLLCVTKKLGINEKSTVFMSEKYDGELNALKISSPPNSWEYHIYQKLNTLDANCFLKPLNYFKYQDESYLVLPYLSQGSLQEMLQCLPQSNSNILKFMDEQMVIYLTIQLVRGVKTMHSLNILHCNLNLRNCMLNIDTSKITFNDLVFIDFDESIDLSILPKDIQFNSSNDQIPEMLKKREWKYQLDYYGLANIVHHLLFNKEITITKSSEDHFIINEPFKKYWQNELWSELFEILLNSEKFKGSINGRVQKLLGKFESWFGLTVDKRKFLENLGEIRSLLQTRKKAA